jgi:hypothetical protein
MVPIIWLELDVEFLPTHYGVRYNFLCLIFYCCLLYYPIGFFRQDELFLPVKSQCLVGVFSNPIDTERCVGDALLAGCLEEKSKAKKIPGRNYSKAAVRIVFVGNEHCKF